jgi:NADH:ubiquinone oxidoreductase subunit 4 (subunit M)
MSWTLFILAALFIPLFPFSMVFNQVHERLRRPWLRALLLLIWPQFGILLIGRAETDIPQWFVAWALLTAVIYAYRAIALRDVGLWIGFLATSAWAVLWLSGGKTGIMHLQALGFSLPLALLSLLTGSIERRFGAAHTRLGLGLASVAPRYAAAFTIALLASTSTPLFPGFFTMMRTIADQVQAAPIGAVSLAVVWLLWTWSAARLVQGIVVGNGRDVAVQDLTRWMCSAYAAGFAGLAVAGVAMARVVL